MPLSALSPEGPVTLVGVDPVSLERMRERNRKEKVFTAKCCGAPVQIRTAEGRIPHFVHLFTPDSCEGDKLETPEHRRLKNEIATAAISASWMAETEARQIEPLTGQTIWCADVLASLGKRKVAFEVQLSNPDWALMNERQERYRKSGVRGLWFVKSKKGFPATKETPIFVIETDDEGDWVRMSRRWDGPYIWDRTNGAEYVELSDFIRSALAGHLKWAPFLGKGETVLDAEIYAWPEGLCKGCGRTIVRAHSAAISIATEPSYPDYYWHAGMSPRMRTNWFTSTLNAVWADVAKHVDVTFITSNNTCCWCRSPRDRGINKTTYKSVRLSTKIKLHSLPQPAFRTVEWDWLRRWAIVQSPSK